MQTGELNNGEVIVYYPHDIPEIVSERFSKSLGEDIKRVFDAYENQATYEELKFNSDMNAYEQELEDYHNELDDIANVLSSILYNSDKMTKQKILGEIKRLEDEIRSYL